MRLMSPSTSPAVARRATSSTNSSSSASSSKPRLVRMVVMSVVLAMYLSSSLGQVWPPSLPPSWSEAEGRSAVTVVQVAASRLAASARHLAAGRQRVLGLQGAGALGGDHLDAASPLGLAPLRHHLLDRPGLQLCSCHRRLSSSQRPPRAAPAAAPGGLPPRGRWQASYSAGHPLQDPEGAALGVGAALGAGGQV